MRRINEYSTVLGSVFSNKKYFYLTAFLLIFFIVLYMAIPILLTPSHSLSFFFEITEWWMWLSIFGFSFLLSVLLSLQFYIWKNLKKVKGVGLSTGLSTVFAFLISLASCVACSVTILTLILPLTGLLFFNEYLYWFLLLGFFVCLFAIHFSINVINKRCEICVQ